MWYNFHYVVENPNISKTQTDQHSQFDVLLLLLTFTSNTTDRLSQYAIGRWLRGQAVPEDKSTKFLHEVQAVKAH